MSIDAIMTNESTSKQDPDNLWNTKFCVDQNQYHVVIMLKILLMHDLVQQWIYGNVWKPEKIHQLPYQRLEIFCFLCLLVSLFRERCNRWKRGLRMCINHLIWWNLWLIFILLLKGCLSKKSLDGLVSKQWPCTLLIKLYFKSASDKHSLHL